MNFRRTTAQVASFLMATVMTLALLTSVNLIATADAPAGLVAQMNAAAPQG